MTAGIERARAKARPASRKRGNREIARIPSGLEGISETMLWTLYDRACESSRADAILVDPDSVRICNAIDYDFAGHFGHPVGAFSARAAEIDRLLKDWLDRHPKGLVISLGEGLETQAHRVDNGHMTCLLRGAFVVSLQVFSSRIGQMGSKPALTFLSLRKGCSCISSRMR